MNNFEADRFEARDSLLVVDELESNASGKDEIEVAGSLGDSVSRDDKSRPSTAEDYQPVASTSQPSTSSASMNSELESRQYENLNKSSIRLIVDKLVQIETKEFKEKSYVSLPFSDLDVNTICDLTYRSKLMNSSSDSESDREENTLAFFDSESDTGTVVNLEGTIEESPTWQTARESTGSSGKIVSDEIKIVEVVSSQDLLSTNSSEDHIDLRDFTKNEEISSNEPYEVCQSKEDEYLSSEALKTVDESVKEEMEEEIINLSNAIDESVKVEMKDGNTNVPYKVLPMVNESVNKEMEEQCDLEGNNNLLEQHLNMADEQVIEEIKEENTNITNEVLQVDDEATKEEIKEQCRLEEDKNIPEESLQMTNKPTEEETKELCRLEENTNLLNELAKLTYELEKEETGEHDDTCASVDFEELEKLFDVCDTDKRSTSSSDERSINLSIGSEFDMFEAETEEDTEEEKKNCEQENEPLDVDNQLDMLASTLFENPDINRFETFEDMLYYLDSEDAMTIMKMQENSSIAEELIKEKVQDFCSKLVLEHRDEEQAKKEIEIASNIIKIDDPQRDNQNDQKDTADKENIEEDLVCEDDPAETLAKMLDSTRYKSEVEVNEILKKLNEQKQKIEDLKNESLRDLAVEFCQFDELLTKQKATAEEESREFIETSKLNEDDFNVLEESEKCQRSPFLEMPLTKEEVTENFKMKGWEKDFRDRQMEEQRLLSACLRVVKEEEITYEGLDLEYDEESEREIDLRNIPIEFIEDTNGECKKKEGEEENLRDQTIREEVNENATIGMIKGKLDLEIKSSISDTILDDVLRSKINVPKDDDRVLTKEQENSPNEDKSHEEVLEKETEPLGLETTIEQEDKNVLVDESVEDKLLVDESLGNVLEDKSLENKSLENKSLETKSLEDKPLEDLTQDGTNDDAITMINETCNTKSENIAESEITGNALPSTEDNTVAATNNNILTRTDSDESLFAELLKREERTYIKGKVYDFDEKKHGVRMTEQFIKKHCRENKLYQTPYLNDVLYLHYKGFSFIENLEKYTGLKTLWLENNGIREIANLENQSELRCLYLHHNIISKIEKLEYLTKLDTLNLSHNMIRKIENLDSLKLLNTLNLSHNYLQETADIEHLRSLDYLSILDISYNRIDTFDIVDILGDMKSLRVIALTGNPVLKNIKMYRKTMTLKCKNLQYLDDRPVFPRDRACAEAWMRGGPDEEAAERRRWIEAEQKRINDSVRENPPKLIEELSDPNDNTITRDERMRYQKQILIERKSLEDPPGGYAMGREVADYEKIILKTSLDKEIDPIPWNFANKETNPKLENEKIESSSTPTCTFSCDTSDLRDRTDDNKNLRKEDLLGSYRKKDGKHPLTGQLSSIRQGMNDFCTNMDKFVEENNIVFKNGNVESFWNDEGLVKNDNHSGCIGEDDNTLPDTLADSKQETLAWWNAEEKEAKVREVISTKKNDNGVDEVEMKEISIKEYEEAGNIKKIQDDRKETNLSDSKMVYDTSALKACPKIALISNDSSHQTDIEDVNEDKVKKINIKEYEEAGDIKKVQNHQQEINLSASEIVYDPLALKACPKVAFISEDSSHQTDVKYVDEDEMKKIDIKEYEEVENIKKVQDHQQETDLSTSNSVYDLLTLKTCPKIAFISKQPSRLTDFEDKYEKKKDNKRKEFSSGVFHSLLAELDHVTRNSTIDNKKSEVKVSQELLSIEEVEEEEEECGNTRLVPLDLNSSIDENFKATGHQEIPKDEGGSLQSTRSRSIEEASVPRSEISEKCRQHLIREAKKFTKKESPLLDDCIKTLINKDTNSGEESSKKRWHSQHDILEHFASSLATPRSVFTQAFEEDGRKTNRTTESVTSLPETKIKPHYKDVSGDFQKPDIQAIADLVRKSEAADQGVHRDVNIFQSFCDHLEELQSKRKLLIAPDFMKNENTKSEIARKEFKPLIEVISEELADVPEIVDNIDPCTTSLEKTGGSNDESL
ncbi:hypothetical protein KPH14_002728 [Odynerus spinipes]|uniref:Dynein axonemal assembly factor 1 homolog n=1 Tax=Odynerus spinipes TaxID=1348599 RepID=A0AAD9RLL1_9HYME|nr:hypothetical protein KPH14_002728 [Odynerus spinipes]